MTWLALLFGLLCAFGGLQSGALAQEGALERIESLVVSLNESLLRTQEELQEVKLCLNQTKKKLGEVQREKESLEAALLETREINGLQRDLQQQNNAVTRLSDRVTQQDMTTGKLKQIVAEQENSVNRLSDSILTQEYTTDNLTRTVAEQGVCIARLKHDVEQIKLSKLYITIYCLYLHSVRCWGKLECMQLQTTICLASIHI